MNYKLLNIYRHHRQYCHYCQSTITENNRCRHHHYYQPEWLHHTSTDWPMTVLSNVLRMILVWRFGGFYFDSDIICMRNLEGLENVAGFLNEDSVNNAHFHARPNHPFIYKILQAIPEEFLVSSFSLVYLYIYLRWSRVLEEVMFLSVLVCLFVLVCLSISRITQKVMYGFQLFFFWGIRGGTRHNPLDFESHPCPTI